MAICDWLYAILDAFERFVQENQEGERDTDFDLLKDEDGDDEDEDEDSQNLPRL